MASDDQPVFVPPGAGRVLGFLSIQHRLTSLQTNGACYIFESTFEPGAGNRLHVHSREDEIGYVLEGAVEIRVRDRLEVLEAGGISRLPRNIPHAIRNPLETPSRYLFIAVPGGLDRWFDALADAQRDGTLDDELYGGLSAEYGIGWLEERPGPE